MEKTKAETDKIEAFSLSLFLALRELENDCGALTKEELLLVLDDIRERWAEE